MSDAAPSQASTFRRSRLGFAGFCFISLLAGWLALRVVLLCAFKPAGLTAAQGALAFASGLHRDLVAALWETLPLLIWLWVVPDRQFRARWHRILLLAGSGLWAFAQIFLLF